MSLKFIEGAYLGAHAERDDRDYWTRKREGDLPPAVVVAVNRQLKTGRQDWIKLTPYQAAKLIEELSTALRVCLIPKASE